MSTHEEVLAKHGYKLAEKEGDYHHYTHPEHPTKITLGPGTGNVQNHRFWTIHHNNKPAGVVGESGIHSARQFEIGIKNHHKALASQHAEQGESYLDYLKKGGKPKQGGSLHAG